MDYQTWKNSVIGQPLLTVDGVTNPDGIECTTVAWSWAFNLVPNVPITQSISTGDARTIYANANPDYFDKIPNMTIGGSSIVPQQGDIAVYDATPKSGWTNQYDNPSGHVGVVDSVDPNGNGVTLVEQDGSNQSLPTHLKDVPYNYDPLIGLLRFKGINMPNVDQSVLDDLNRWKAVGQQLSYTTAYAAMGGTSGNPDADPTQVQPIIQDIEAYANFVKATPAWLADSNLADLEVVNKTAVVTAGTTQSSSPPTPAVANNTTPTATPSLPLPTTGFIAWLKSLFTK